MILPANTEIAKQSVAYVNESGCSTKYVADVLRDIADALTSIHPLSEGDSYCYKYNNLRSFMQISLLNFLWSFKYEEGWKNIIYSSQNVHNELFDIVLSKKSDKYFS